ncbi:MAG TPA: response regulator transcription factor [Fimbriimonadaceae bacterium]|nr:DNA-binding response regulator [Armatimonadota bacterium]HCM73348.1 DNA-binding response regulator [Armatimonadota bacterium]HRD32134.1 response regulator transcription factor [Fimbriimonadaceae bacterium]HRE93943.1 response regulator transcription factor [Fimbriimonadaceae bacterium]HRI72922.1 response regulator transcription factor [Fimbriimonadaceae bacterium]
MKILIVDDEPNILETVELRLRKDGYSTFTAASAEEGMRLFRLVRPDLVLLDVMLPKQSGYDMCRTIRRDSHVPVIFLTARGGEDDRVTGLEIGGDDYMVKPFSLSELSARVRSVLRRSGSSIRTLEIVETGNLIINPKTHEATMDGKPVALSPKEFALLYFLAQNPGQVFSRETLLDRVWGADAYVSSRTVDVHIRWLRERIEQNPAHPERIITIRGVGYKFQG